MPLAHLTSLYRGLLSGHIHASMLAGVLWLVVATAFFYMLALKGMQHRLVE